MLTALAVCRIAQASRAASKRALFGGDDGAKILRAIIETPLFAEIGNAEASTVMPRHQNLVGPRLCDTLRYNIVMKREIGMSL